MKAMRDKKLFQTTEQKIYVSVFIFIFNTSWVSNQVILYPTNKISYHNLKTDSLKNFKFRLVIWLITVNLAFHSACIFVISLKDSLLLHIVNRVIIVGKIEVIDFMSKKTWCN